MRSPGVDSLAFPSEAETLLAFKRSTEVANLPTFLKLGNAVAPKWISHHAPQYVRYEPGSLGDFPPDVVAFL